MTTPELASDRLILRPLDIQRDLDALHKIHSDVETMRFMPSPPHTSKRHTRDEYRHALANPASPYWAIFLKDGDAAIGHIKLFGDTPIPGLGYILRRDHWNQGITTEACRLALDHCFNTLELDRMELWIDEDNHASQRVAVKLGFQKRSRIPLKYRHNPESHVMGIWGQWAAEWRGEPHVATTPTLFRGEPVLYVQNVARSSTYYRDKLGFRIDFLFGNPPTHGGVSRGEWTGSQVSLQLSQREDHDPKTASGYLYIMMDSSIDVLHDQYRDTGVEIIDPPADRPWGLREFAILDLDGHQLRFGAHI